MSSCHRYVDLMFASVSRPRYLIMLSQEVSSLKNEDAILERQAAKNARCILSYASTIQPVKCFTPWTTQASQFEM